VTVPTARATTATVGLAVTGVAENVDTPTVPGAVALLYATENVWLFAQFSEIVTRLPTTLVSVAAVHVPLVTTI
jgi:hypothetical protein